jgi:DNA polymerase III epsilon subunit-like protein
MLTGTETYISVDIETAGPNPSTYSLLSIGACDVFNLQNTFYVELAPVNANKVSHALEISGLNWEDLKTDGVTPEEAMSRFAEWVNTQKQGENQPIFVAFNAPFDWMFVNDYFQRYLGYNPFGHKALDIKAFYMGLRGVSWDETGIRHISKRYLENKNLSHHALQDALDQAVIFRKLLAEAKK